MHILQIGSNGKVLIINFKELNIIIISILFQKAFKNYNLYHFTMCTLIINF